MIETDVTYTLERDGRFYLIEDVLLWKEDTMKQTMWGNKVDRCLKAQRIVTRGWGASFPVLVPVASRY